MEKVQIEQVESLIKTNMGEQDSYLVLITDGNKSYLKTNGDQRHLILALYASAKDNSILERTILSTALNLLSRQEELAELFFEQLKEAVKYRIANP